MLRPRNLGAIVVDDLRLEFIRRAVERMPPGAELLDAGCGVKPFEGLYADRVARVVGVDTPFTLHGQTKVDVFAFATSLPFRDGSFDVILCTEVMEHVAEPATMLREFFRVLRPGGALVMTTPFLVPLHEEPFDFYRYTKHGLRHLCGSAGFAVRSVEPFAELFGVILSFLVQAQLRAWRPFSKLVRLPVLATVWNPLVFLTVYVPQVLYVKIYRWMRGAPRLRRIVERLSYTTKGYGLVAHRPDGDDSTARSR